MPVQVTAGVSSGAGGRYVVSNKGKMSKLEPIMSKGTGTEHIAKKNSPLDAHY